MADDNKTDAGINRRTLLRGVGSAALAASMTSVASARSTGATDAREPNAYQKFAAGVTTDVDEATHEELVGRYSDPESVENAFRGNTDDILQELAAEGHIESASLEPFVFDEVQEGAKLEPTDAATGVGVTSIEREEGASANLLATTASEEHAVALYYQPEFDTAHAFVDTDDGRVAVHNLGDDGVSTDGLGCGWEQEFCYNSICDFEAKPNKCTAQEAYCCYPTPDYERTCSDTRYVCSCTCS